MCVIGSTFLIFMFVDQLLLVDVFSQLYYLTRAKKTTIADFRYKSLKSCNVSQCQFNLPLSPISVCCYAVSLSNMLLFLLREGK